METTHATHIDKLKILTHPVVLLVTTVVILGVAAGGFAWQCQRSSSLKSQIDSLNTQLTALQKQKAALHAARTVSTSNWKLECDEHNNLCFELPSDWTPNTFTEDTDGIGGLQSTDPSKSLMVSYRNHYIKDGGSATFHVSSITSVPDSSLKLQIVGGYYVAENRQPFYIVVGSEQVSNYGSPLKVGQNVAWGNTERFEVTTSDTSSPHDDIQFIALPQGQTFPSAQAADAWFSSVNGLTALKVMESLVSGSSYTGKYLNVPELGVRMKLTYNTEDAYYVIRQPVVAGGQPFAHLTTHSLDQYQGCSLSASNMYDGIAYIASFTKGQTDPVVGDYATAFPKAPLINGRYYYTGRGQYDCTNGNASSLLSNASHDFVNAYQTIESIPKQ